MPSSSSTLDAARERHRAGQLEAAERLYQAVLDETPEHGEAAFLLGSIALQTGRVDQSLRLFLKAVAQRPDDGAYHANLGEAYRRLGRVPEAVDALTKAMSLRHDLVAPVFNLGLLLEQVGDVDAAVACFERAVAVQPGAPVIEEHLALARRTATNPKAALTSCTPLSAGVLLALAAIERSMGRKEHVVHLCRRALAADRSVRTLNRLGEALAEVERTDEAVVCFENALKLQPNEPESVALLAEVLCRACRVDEAIAGLRRCIRIKEAPGPRDLLITTLPYSSGYDDAAILAEARSWDRDHGLPVTARVQSSFPNDRSPERPLRIGYVSRDFRDHAHKFFLQPLFANRDRQAFQSFLYSDVPAPDSETSHFRALADEWRDVATLDDTRCAALVRDDRIDVLVDLTMHLARNRLLVFARKPAPIQMCWLAYPGTTGLSAMDYQ